jgi:CubicO group peptidase (beta-lactamase class C family)
MADSGFTFPEEKLGRLAAVYGRDSATGRLVRREVPVPLPPRMWGGGGLVSTLDDYARFACMLANRGEYAGIRLLSPTTVAMFSQNWAAPEALPSFVEAAPDIHGGYGYSLGTSVLLDPGPTGKFGNPGEFYWGGAFSTYFWIDPQEALFGIFMTQFDPNWAYPIPWQLKQLAYQAMVT